MLLVYLLVLGLPLLGQQINGVVKDYRGFPLEGVKVGIQGESISRLTDKKGRYALPLPSHLKTKKLFELTFHKPNYYATSLQITAEEISASHSVFMVDIRKINETINVTALNREEEKLAIPMVENTIGESEIREKTAESIVDTITDTPGIHFIGKGGYMVTPSIRGLARRRVLLMVDGFRISGDRSVGSSASFLSPALLTGIDVVRSSSSVFYGSDAIGGVMNIRTRPLYDSERHPERVNHLNLNLGSINSRFSTGIQYGYRYKPYFVYGGIQYSAAGNYKSRDIEVLNAGYSLWSGVFDLSYSSKKRDVYIGYIGGTGIDMGKPDRDNDPKKRASVPLEKNHIFRLGITEKQLMKNVDFTFSAAINPTLYQIEKRNDYQDKTETSSTEALNFAVKGFFSGRSGDNLTWQLGMDLFLRNNLDIRNEILQSGSLQSLIPLENGRRKDIAPFLSFSYRLGRSFRIEGGYRMAFFSSHALSNTVEKKMSTDAHLYFIGLNHRLTPHVSMFINLGRAHRVPSLSELYYTGISGRRYVEGNPLLQSEEGFNIDGGIRYRRENGYLGLYMFRNSIRNLIERYRAENGNHRYGNLDSGLIYGGELEFGLPLTDRIDLSGYYQYYRGKSRSDEVPLNDVPSPKLYLKAQYYLGNFRLDLSCLHSYEKKNPGPAEINNAAYTVINVNGIFYFSTRFHLFLNISNLLNRQYYANPDPDIPLSKGLDISVGFRLGFQ